MKKQAYVNKQLKELEDKSAECVALAIKIVNLIDKNDDSRSRSSISVVRHKAILSFESSAQLLNALLKNTL
jgi:hypothetical protein